MDLCLSKAPLDGPDESFTNGGMNGIDLIPHLRLTFRPDCIALRIAPEIFVTIDFDLAAEYLQRRTVSLPSTSAKRPYPVSGSSPARLSGIITTTGSSGALRDCLLLSTGPIAEETR